MAAENAPRDQNFVPADLFQIDGAARGQLMAGRIDQATGRILVDVSGGPGTAVVNEVVAGSGTSWTLANTPTSGVALYANGQRLTPTVDYSIVGAAITTVLSWDAGTLLADYSY